ncbi:MAG: DNA mismatch repair protein MutS, partial [Treponema sp.]|nr:DNA mismatch repair protein MutS [Treponema sp.]
MEQDITPLMAQYDAIKNQHKNEVLFFRLCDFYEMFGDDAVEVSRLLNLTLTHRSNRHMCGIPFHASKVYIARLLRLGKKIAICEQVGEVPKGKGITERAVVEIITPGTATESEYLENNNNNYLASCCVCNGKASFACIDVSTASFAATSWNASKMEEHFAKELERSAARELLLPLSLKTNEYIQRTLSLYPRLSVSYYPDWNFSLKTSYAKLTTLFGTANLQGFGLTENSSEIVSAGFLIDYLEKTTSALLPHIKSIQVFNDSEYLQLDESSARNLEITNNLHDGSEHYTLLECLNHTKTAMGNRMLRSYLAFPLTDIKKIQERQKRVLLFFENKKLLEDVRKSLSPILDIERLAARIAMERAHPKDLQALRFSLENYLELCTCLEKYELDVSNTEDASKVIDLISTTIVPDPPTVITEGGIILDSYSEELDHYRKIYTDFGNILSEYENEEREKTGIANLKIKYTNAAGYFIEVTKGKLSSVPSHFIMRRALVNGDRY